MIAAELWTRGLESLVGIAMSCIGLGSGPEFTGRSRTTDDSGSRLAIIKNNNHAEEAN
jgi:hypothetical protein